MKYILVSILMLALLASLCLFSACSVSKATMQTAHLLEAAVKLQKQGDQSGTVALVQAASAKWRSKEVFFGTVLRHDEIDNVTTDFARLESYAESEDDDDFLSGCAALLAQLQHIREMEWPEFKNIM